MIHHEDADDTVKIDWEPYKQITPEPFRLKLDTSSVSKHLGNSLKNNNNDKNTKEPMITMKELLHQFYTFKSNYEKLNKYSFITNKNKDKNKDKNKNKNKKENDYLCVRCHKKGGTFFTIKNGKYHAKCGNGKLCFEFIFKMPHEIPSIENKLIQMKKTDQIQKETIIQQKMETLFGYKELHITVKEFKKQINGIMEENVKLTKTEEEYQNVSVNEKRIDLVEKLTIRIQTEINHLIELSLSEKNTNTNMDDIVTLNNRITELYVELRNIKYDVMEVQHLYDEKNNVTISKLVQKIDNSKDIQLCLEPAIEKYFMKPLDDHHHDNDVFILD